MTWERSAPSVPDQQQNERPPKPYGLYVPWNPEKKCWQVYRLPKVEIDQKGFCGLVLSKEVGIGWENDYEAKNLLKGI